MSAPPGYDEVCKEIERLQENASDNAYQEQVLRKVVAYIKANMASHHWFCDKYMFPMLTHLLILFLFNSGGVLEKFKPAMEANLSQCSDCVKLFNNLKLYLRMSFLIVRKVPMQQVMQFLNIIIKWEGERVAKVLANPDLDPVVLNNAILAVMCDPNLLRLDLKIVDDFLARLQQLNYVPDAPFAGIAFVALELSTKPAMRAMAFRWMQLLTQKHIKLKPLEVMPPLVDGIMYYFYRIQNSKYYTDDALIKFWLFLNKFFELFENDAIIEKFNSPPDLELMSAYSGVHLYLVVRVLFNNLMSSLDEPMLVLFSVLAKFLDRFGLQLWSHTDHISYSQLLDATLSNPNYSRRLLDPETLTVAPFLSLWFDPLLKLISPVQFFSAVVRMATYLFNLCANALVKPLPRVIELRKIATNYLLQMFEGDPVPVTSDKYLIYMLQRREARANIDTFHSQILELATKDKYAPAQQLVAKCIAYDISLYGHNTIELANGRAPELFDQWPQLYHTLAARPIYESEFCRLIIPLFAGIIYVVSFLPRKGEAFLKVLTDLRTQHNLVVDGMMKLYAKVLDNISLNDAIQLRSAVLTPEGAAGMWAVICLRDVAQPGLDLLYMAFLEDGGARLEGIKHAIEADPELALSVIADTLTKVVTVDAFEPCPKIVRIIMDVYTALLDPLLGLLILGKVTDDTKVLALWRELWGFLKWMYDKTFVWAHFYATEHLQEFARDTLDVLRQIFDLFRLLSQLVDATPSELFEPVMRAFNLLVVWLRLGDPVLLNLCLGLVFDGFNLLMDLKIDMDAKFLTYLISNGARAKKFNNKLTTEQRSDILNKAREYGAGDLVDKIVLETTKSRTVVIDDKSPSPGLSYTSRKASQPSQQTLSRFGTTSDVAPRAPPSAPAPKFKLAGMEAIRAELKMNREGAVKAPSPPVVAPAAARPAGFNRKKDAPQVLRQTNLKKSALNNADSLDEEGETDYSDLFVELKTKTKVIEVDMHGRPIARSLNKPLGPTAEELKRKEEERMRLRLNVNLKLLYLQILRWDYNRNDNYPTDDNLYKGVKLTYDDAKDYVKTVEPLVLLECWLGIRQERQLEQQLPFKVMIGLRTTVDGFFDVYTLISKQALVDRKIGDLDLFVLAPAEHFFAGGEPNWRDAARHIRLSKTTCLAKVREIKHGSQGFSDVTLRVYPQGLMIGLLTPKMEVLAMKASNMVTVEREYLSLKGLQYYDLQKEILLATPTEPKHITDEEAKRVGNIYGVNPSQAKAIVGLAHSQGFSLIQGPPGTGKTKTILGCIGYFLSNSANPKALKIPGQESKVDLANTPKVLICAPSNAAVDELLVRIREGIKMNDGLVLSPKVVRLGRSDAINASVKDLTLEELVDKELKARMGSTKGPTNDPKIREEHTAAIKERDTLRAQLNSSTLSESEVQEVETKLREVNKRRNTLAQKLDLQREQASIQYRTREIERRNAQAKILTGSDIICSTLSGSAHDFLKSLLMKFDSVIIDEACQCVELLALIPLRYGARKCIMVGDPNQLPPTVLSQVALKLDYEQSLFVRMQRQHPNLVYLLDVQYRMHPEISVFPSREFYHGRLLDGPGMAEKNTRPWHQQYPFTPFRFFNVTSKHQVNELSRSLFNRNEAQMVLEMVQEVQKFVPPDKFSGMVGIISPYKEQVRVIRDLFIRKYGQIITKEIDFNTVDGFQGQEKEIIIMSTVRALELGNVGFLSDVRRMNVALTRARTSLWILGNAQSLKRNKVWNRLITDVENRNNYSDVNTNIRLMIKQGNASQTRITEPRITEIEPSIQEPPKDIAIRSPSPSSLPPVPRVDLQNSNKHVQDEVTHPNKRPKVAPVVPRSKSKIFRETSSAAPAPHNNHHHHHKPYIHNKLPPKPPQPTQSGVIPSARPPPRPNKLGKLQKPSDANNLFIRKKSNQRP